MAGNKPSIFVAFFVVLLSIKAIFVSGQANTDAASTHYVMLPPSSTGQERVFCLARGACHNKRLVCPTQCPQRKPKKNKKIKGCFIDCSSKCEVTCKCRLSCSYLHSFLLGTKKKKNQR